MSKVIKNDRVFYDDNPIKIDNSEPHARVIKATAQGAENDKDDVSKILSRNAVESAQISVGAAIKDASAIRERGKVEARFAFSNGINDGKRQGNVDGAKKGKLDGESGSQLLFKNAFDKTVDKIQQLDNQTLKDISSAKNDCVNFAFDLAENILGIPVDRSKEKYKTLADEFLSSKPDDVTLTVNGIQKSFKTLQTGAILNAADGLQGILAYKEVHSEPEMPEEPETSENEEAAKPEEIPQQEAEAEPKEQTPEAPSETFDTTNEEAQETFEVAENENEEVPSEFDSQTFEEAAVSTVSQENVEKEGPQEVEEPQDEASKAESAEPYEFPNFDEEKSSEEEIEENKDEAEDTEPSKEAETYDLPDFGDEADCESEVNEEEDETSKEDELEEEVSQEESDEEPEKNPKEEIPEDEPQKETEPKDLSQEENEKFVFIRPVNKKSRIASMDDDELTIEDVAAFPQSDLKNILKKLEPREIASALQRESAEAKDAILSSLTRKNREKTEEAIKFLGPFSEEESKKAKDALITLAAEI